MKLYLIQHGLSLPEEQDPQKPLSEEGKEETQKMGRFIKAEKISVASIWHSKKMRSIETVRIITEYIEKTEINERVDLNPNDGVGKIKEELEAVRQDIMIVGHLPFLQKLASLLLFENEENDSITFKNSGIICLECQEKWKLLWEITPDLL